MSQSKVTPDPYDIAIGPASDELVIPGATPLAGWECPRCGQVWAPHIAMCSCAPPSVTISSVEHTYDDRQIGAVLKACAVCGQMRYFTNPASEVCGACRT